MKIEIEAEKVVVLTSPHESDVVYIHAKLPCGIYPFEGCTLMSIKIASEKGEQWAIDNLHVKPEVIRI